MLALSLFPAMPPGPMSHGSGQDDHSKKILIDIFLSCMVSDILIKLMFWTNTISSNETHELLE